MLGCLCQGAGLLQLPSGSSTAWTQQSHKRLLIGFTGALRPLYAQPAAFGGQWVPDGIAAVGANCANGDAMEWLLIDAEKRCKMIKGKGNVAFVVKGSVDVASLAVKAQRAGAVALVVLQPAADRGA